MQQSLKAASRVAWAWIIAPQFLIEFLVIVDNALSLLYVGFRGEPFAPLTGDLKSSPVVRNQFVAS
jgi:hypothetical protein